MSRPYWEKRQLKKQDAVIDITNSPMVQHENRSNKSALEADESGHSQDSLNKSRPLIHTSSVQSDEIHVISNTPDASSKWTGEKDLKMSKEDTPPTPAKKAYEFVLQSDKPAMEITSMLDGTTLKQAPKKNSVLMSKIRAFTKMRANMRLSKSETVDSYVVEQSDNGPVCLIQDSPLRIFKVSTNFSH